MIPMASKSRSKDNPFYDCEVCQIYEGEAMKCFKKNFTLFATRYANAHNANEIPPVFNHEVMNAKFRNVIQLLVQSVTNLD